MRRRWLACFGLASLYALCSIPILILSSLVMFLPNINPKLADLTPAQSIQVLNSYYFRSALFVFPAYVLLRLVAARIYGSALVKAVQTGAVAQVEPAPQGSGQVLVVTMFLFNAHGSSAPGELVYYQPL